MLSGKPTLELNTLSELQMDSTNMKHVLQASPPSAKNPKSTSERQRVPNVVTSLKRI